MNVDGPTRPQILKLLRTAALAWPRFDLPESADDLELLIDIWCEALDGFDVDEIKEMILGWGPWPPSIGELAEHLRELHANDWMVRRLPPEQRGE